MACLHHHVLVHLVGHHDLYLHFDTPDGQVTALHDGHATWSTGNALQTLLDAPNQTAEVEGDTDTVRLARGAPLGWPKAKVRDRLIWKHKAVDFAVLAASPVTSLRVPVLAAALAAFRGDLKGARGTVILVTTGPEADGEGREQLGHSTQSVGAVLHGVLTRTSLGADLEVLPPVHLATDRPHDFADVPTLVRTLGRELANRRREVVEAGGDDWAKRFRLVLSVNTGPNAVIAGLIRGLDEFGPHLLHIGDARRWPESEARVPTRLTGAVLDGDALRQRPSVAVEAFAADPAVACALTEMTAWRDAFVSARPERPTALARSSLRDDKERLFWFRKGLKEVLAVLVVRDPATGALRAFRGVNLEVSLPTGTLCAERNAIGTAFATLPSLERRHIEAVAVLSLSDAPRLGPCGACREWLQKMAEANPDLRVVTFEDEALSRVFVEPAAG